MLVLTKQTKVLTGDVADGFQKCKSFNSSSGGVGPMTIACLLKNTIDCFKRSQI